MNNSRPIFRPEALKRYAEGRERSVLPPTASARTTWAIWIIVGSLIIGSIAIWLAQIPVYVSGLAIAVNPPVATDNTQNSPVLLTLFPPAAQPAIGEGKSIIIQLDSSSEPVERRAIAFANNEAEARNILAEFSLENHPAVAAMKPSAVVITQLEPLPAGGMAVDYVGRVFHADIRVGSRRAATLLPFVDELL